MPVRGLAYRLGRLFVIVGGASLGALHVAVLFRRVTDGTLLRPWVIAQWLAALGLVAVAEYLRRRGMSVFRGRPAVVFWIVVALMHGMVAMPGAPGLVGVLHTIPITDSLPLGAGVLVVALATLAGILALGAKPALVGLEMRRALAALLPMSSPRGALSARGPPV